MSNYQHKVRFTTSLEESEQAIDKLLAEMKIDLPRPQGSASMLLSPRISTLDEIEDLPQG